MWLVTDFDKERFQEKLIKTDSCWFMRGQNPKRYARFWLDGTMLGAHKVSYLMFKGPIPEGMNVLHSCDVECCVNPDHLFLGTHTDNMQDKAKKGRGNPPRGERAHSAKITSSDVIDICRSKEDTTTLAERYGLTTTAIRYILCGKTWGHVTGRVWQRRRNYAKD